MGLRLNLVIKGDSQVFILSDQWNDLGGNDRSLRMRFILIRSGNLRFQLFAFKESHNPAFRVIKLHVIFFTPIFYFSYRLFYSLFPRG